MQQRNQFLLAFGHRIARQIFLHAQIVFHWLLVALQAGVPMPIAKMAFAMYFVATSPVFNWPRLVKATQD